MSGEQRTYPDPDPDFDRMSLEEIRTFIRQTENTIVFGRDHGAEEIFVTGLVQQRRRAEAALKRRTNGHDSHANPDTYDEIAAILTAAGFDGISEGSVSAVEYALRTLGTLLHGADELRRAAVREAAIKKLESLKINSPARFVDAALKSEKRENDTLQGQALNLADPEPWPETVDGAKLLDDVAAAFRRFVLLPKHADTVQALWCVHAHALDAFGISPVLEINSPELECGKSVNQSVLRRMAPRALTTTSISMSSIFRTVEKFKPTLFVDEGDAFLNLNEDLRGILNSSHLRNDAFVIRTEGDEHEPRTFSTWCAKSIALIGNLPPTLRSRSITIQMKRKTGKDKVEDFHGHYPYPELEVLKRQAWRWTHDNLAAIKGAKSQIPDGLINRTKDNWSPLFAIAEIAGGQWPKKCREAALGFQKSKPDETSVGVMLLADLQNFFRESEGKPLPTEEILAELTKLDERPWGEWKKGKPISAIQLARLLKPFGIRSRTIRVRENTPKGYGLDECHDAFTRYIADPEPPHPQQANSFTDLGSYSEAQQPDNVADEKDGLSFRNQSDVADVADQNPGAARRTHKVEEGAEPKG